MIMLTPIATQHYLVLITLQCKISFVASFTISMWLKKYYYNYTITQHMGREKGDTFMYLFMFCLLIVFLHSSCGRIIIMFYISCNGCFMNWEYQMFCYSLTEKKEKK